RPAWRIIHTGVTSTGCLSSARRKRSFFRLGMSNLQVIEDATACLTSLPDSSDNEIGATNHVAPGEYFRIAGLEGVFAAFRCQHPAPTVEIDTMFGEPRRRAGLEAEGDQNGICRQDHFATRNFLGYTAAPGIRLT